MIRHGLFALWLVLLGHACSRRVPVPPPSGLSGLDPDYFLVVGDPPVLVPPGVRDPSTATAKISLGPAESDSCPAGDASLRIEVSEGELTVVVERAALEAMQRGELSRRTVELEVMGCSEPGTGRALARRLAHAIPLPLGDDRRLLEASELLDGYIDLRPGYELRAVRPVFRDGAAAGASAVADGPAVSGGPGGSLTVEMRATDDLVGIERAWYSLSPSGAVGRASVRFEKAMLVIEGEEEERSAPMHDWLDFGAEPRFFRMLFLSRRTTAAEHDLHLLAAETPAALAEQTLRLQRDAAACPALSGCRAAPAETALLAFVNVEVNGAPVFVAPGAKVRDALREAGLEGRGIDELWKPWRDTRKLVRAPANPEALLAIPLLGGERILTAR